MMYIREIGRSVECRLTEHRRGNMIETTIQFMQDLIKVNTNLKIQCEILRSKSTKQIQIDKVKNGIRNIKTNDIK